MKKNQIVLLGMAGLSLGQIKNMDDTTAELFIEEFRKFREANPDDLTHLGFGAQNLAVGIVSNLGEDISEAKDEFDKLNGKARPRSISIPNQIQFGEWTVNGNNDLINSKHGYNIQSNGLTEDQWKSILNSWIFHLSSKPWCDFNDFISAYMCILGRIIVRTKFK